jgi:hypothetical protein
MEEGWLLHANTKQMILGGFRDGVVSWLLFILLAATMFAQNPAPRTIDKGMHSSIGAPREVVIRTLAEYNAFWKEHRNESTVAAVDFSKEMVVGVFMGRQPTAGYSITIVSASEVAGVLTIHYRTSSPPRDAMTAQVMTVPYHLVAIPQSSAATVRFERIE